MKKTFLSFVLIAFLIFSSFHSCANSDSFSITQASIESSTDTGDSLEWADGTFECIIYDSSGMQIGGISGYLTQGRNPTVGSFQGSYTNIDGVLQGTIHGFYKGGKLVGFLKGADSFTSMFFGKITGNSTHFTAEIKSTSLGDIYVSGVHSDSFLPMLTGEYDVGIVSYHLVDLNRLELFTDQPDDYREMMLQIWYPAAKGTSTERTSYMDTITFEWLFNRSPVPLITIPDNAYEFVRPYSMNAPFADTSERFPVIVFSHGYDGVYQIYTSLIEDIVSHGFIVASINHPYIAGITVFPDGRTTFVEPINGNISIESVVSDVTFVLDWLESINQTDEILAGTMDLNHIGMYGHSFGGAATAICCYQDDRIKAGLTLDGVVYSDRVPDDFDKPFLMLLAEGSNLRMGTEYLWDLLNNEVYTVEIIGSTHYGYTDVGILLDHFVPLIPSKYLGFGEIDAKRLVLITKAYEIAFFETYLKGEPLENLMQLEDYYEEVIFQFQ